MTWEYSEDNLIEQTAIDLFFNRLGWDTLLAYNKEGFGDGSTLGRLNKKEVVLKRFSLKKSESSIQDYLKKRIKKPMKNSWKKASPSHWQKSILRNTSY